MAAEGLARKLNKTLGPPQFQLSVWGREVLLSLASAWTEKGFKENRRTIRAEAGATNTENQASENCGETGKYSIWQDRREAAGPRSTLKGQSQYLGGDTLPYGQ